MCIAVGDRFIKRMRDRIQLYDLAPPHVRAFQTKICFQVTMQTIMKAKFQM
jgi:hypothetical protein